MTRIEASVDVDAPPEVVWSVLSDVDRYDELSAAFTDEVTYVSDGPVGEGTVYRERGGVGPITDESEWRIVEFDPPRRQVHVGDLGVMEPVLTVELSPHGDGTRLRQTVDVTVLPQFRPLGWLAERLFVRRAMVAGLRDTVENAKRMAEAEAAAAEVTD